MTPKEKAKEIYCKYTDALNIRDLQTTANPFAKQCALIAVNEILKVTEPYLNRHEPDYLELPSEMTQGYWLEVKQEIEKL